MLSFFCPFQQVLQTYFQYVSMIYISDMKFTTTKKPCRLEFEHGNLIFCRKPEKFDRKLFLKKLGSAGPVEPAFCKSDSALCQQLAVKAVLMQNDISHHLSPSKASWGVTIQDMTVKHDGFGTLEFPLIRRIHSSRHRRQRALCHLSREIGQGELVV